MSDSATMPGDATNEPMDPISGADQATMVAAHTTPGPYTLGPNSQPRPDVPRGTVTPHHMTSQAIYPGVGHDYWVYVPAQYDAAHAAALMVFQDGALYLGAEAQTPTVFDNLIAQSAMPPTIGVFVNPGDKGPGMPRWGGTDNRSLEYDSLGDRYARFLLDELLPPIAAEYNITPDPAGRAIGGISSGGICAFTVAWERPDQFSKVISHCGSFTAIRGGDRYPGIVRKTLAKSLRVFLQTGTHDLDVVYGNWPLANQQMAAALAYRGYDHQLVVGEGGHNLVHGGAILPDTLRWLWRDYTG